MPAIVGVGLGVTAPTEVPVGDGVGEGVGEGVGVAPVPPMEGAVVEVAAGVPPMEGAGEGVTTRVNLERVTDTVEHADRERDKEPVTV